MKGVKTVKDVKCITHIIEKNENSIRKERNRKHINENSDSYERRKWCEELKAYNKENKTDVKNVYETSEQKRYAVNRGIHTMEFQKEFWKEKKKKFEKKHIPILLFKNGKGILGIARKINWYENEEEKKIEFEYEKIVVNVKAKRKLLEDLLEKIEVNEKEYKTNEIIKILFDNKFEMYEIVEE